MAENNCIVMQRVKYCEHPTAPELPDMSWPLAFIIVGVVFVMMWSLKWV